MATYTHVHMGALTITRRSVVQLGLSINLSRSDRLMHLDIHRRTHGYTPDARSPHSRIIRSSRNNVTCIVEYVNATGCDRYRETHSIARSNGLIDALKRYARYVDAFGGTLCLPYVHVKIREKLRTIGTHDGHESLREYHSQVESSVSINASRRSIDAPLSMLLDVSEGYLGQVYGQASIGNTCIGE